MKEEDIKKIISKSTVETSDDFINNLMNTVVAQKKAKQKTFWWSFPVILVICSILTLLIIGMFNHILHNKLTFSNGLVNNIPRTPFLLIITATILFYINNIIRITYYYKKNNF